jgi:hypothetical protein
MSAVAVARPPLAFVAENGLAVELSWDDPTGEWVLEDRRSA